MPLPLTRNDYLELLPVRWQAITEHGIRIHHRTYDHDVLGPHRGEPSPVAGRGGKWEIHTNPHDVRQIWIRLPQLGLTEIPWIHRDHAHQPFSEQTWRYLRTTIARQAREDAPQAEAALAEALDALMRRARTGQATNQEQHLLTRTTTPRTPPPPRSHNTIPPTRPGPGAPHTEADSLDGPDQDQEQDQNQDQDTEDLAYGQATDGPAVPVAGYGLYDAAEEALKW
ncbi:Mu transposase C-terminal domain-containing protein [Streptomyces sp. CB01201]|uniref:Mu transposase C-terminal domain-containing protein n=1 Tax=Streptomyces sp. CB01201 TaxID=2020324 RepID=UPI0018FE5BC4|nr:Mu transposase C-terminal domain-containing protein [Streptomyces sp. CB01201]